MKHFRSLTFALLIVFLFSSFANKEREYEFYNYKKNKPLGVSIVLYRVNAAKKLDDLNNLETQFSNEKSVNLYKITEDLGIIFMNTPNPYNHDTSIPYKMLFGNYVEKKVGYRVVNGFMSNLEIASICKWIAANKINNYEGFQRMYNNISKEAKKALEQISAEDSKSLFIGYVEPLTKFYFSALKGKNSVVFCAE